MTSTVGSKHRQPPGGGVGQCRRWDKALCEGENERRRSPAVRRKRRSRTAPNAVNGDVPVPSIQRYQSALDHPNPNVSQPNASKNRAAPSHPLVHTKGSFGLQDFEGIPLTKESFLSYGLAGKKHHYYSIGFHWFHRICNIHLELLEISYAQSTRSWMIVLPNFIQPWHSCKTNPLVFLWCYQSASHLFSCAFESYRIRL